VTQNLRSLYNEVQGMTDAERRADIERRARTNADLFKSRMLAGSQNEPGDQAYLRDVVVNVCYDYYRRTYPELTPEQANSKAKRLRLDDLAAAQQDRYDRDVKAGLEKAERDFKRWCKKREAFERALRPEVHGRRLSWKINEVPGLRGVKYDFSKLLNRDFGNVDYSDNKQTLAARMLDAYTGYYEEVTVITGKRLGDVAMFTVFYRPRGV